MLWSFPFHPQAISMRVHTTEAYHVVGSEDEFKELFLININEISIPLAYDLLHVRGLQRLLDFFGRVVDVILHILNNLLKNSTLHIGERDFLLFLV